MNPALRRGNPCLMVSESCTCCFQEGETDAVRPRTWCVLRRGWWCGRDRRATSVRRTRVAREQRTTWQSQSWHSHLHCVGEPSTVSIGGLGRWPRRCRLVLYAANCVQWAELTPGRVGEGLAAQSELT
ncbi:hypothetical protein L1887_48829 [Cichorium endivia]|nr:hypothetical protein L1887_48829 [Cichorium endivia]